MFCVGVMYSGEYNACDDLLLHFSHRSRLGLKLYVRKFHLLTYTEFHLQIHQLLQLNHPLAIFHSTRLHLHLLVSLHLCWGLLLRKKPHSRYIADLSMGQIEMCSTVLKIMLINICFEYRNMKHTSCT